MPLPSKSEVGSPKALYTIPETTVPDCVGLSQFVEIWLNWPIGLYVLVHVIPFPLLAVSWSVAHSSRILA